METPLITAFEPPSGGTFRCHGIATTCNPTSPTWSRDNLTDICGTRTMLYQCGASGISCVITTQMMQLPECH